MKSIEFTSLSIEQVQEMVRRELSAPTRIGYLLMFLVTTTAACLIGTLWLTEPEPLPWRTHLALGSLVAINVAWSMLFGWVLTRRKVLFAMHRVMAGWMALLFCGIFLVVGLTIAAMNMNLSALLAIGLIGCAQVAAAIVMLAKARHRRQQLLQRRDELVSMLGQSSQM
jgi:hypothetical protein